MIPAQAMLSFFMAAGDRDTVRLLCYIMAQCFFGAAAMQVANILCGNMLDRYLEIAFDSVFITLESTVSNTGYQWKARRSGPGGVTWPFQGDTTTASTRPSRPRRGRSQSLPPPTSGTEGSRSRGRSMSPAGS